MMRSKYGEYPEYHTSLDDLDNVVTAEGLGNGFSMYQRAIEAIERDCHYVATTLCEPQLSRRGLYPEIGGGRLSRKIQLLSDILSHADGGNSLLDIAEQMGEPVWELYESIDTLTNAGLIARAQPGR